VFAALACMLATAAAAADRSDAYPTKPVRFIVAFPPGGNVDLMGRLAAAKLTEAFGRPFVVDNRGGAGGIIAEEITARAVGDGYTLLMVSLAHTVSAAMNRKLAYDPLRDLIPVSLLVSVPNVLVVHRSVAAQSVPELIKLVRSKPGELNYASAYATTSHIAGELFKSMTGTDILNVNYKSAGLAVPDIESGRVQLAFSVITSAMSMLKNGRIRALAVTSAKRSSALPELPAMSEFVPGYEVTGWQGILAPAATPRPIVTKLSAELSRSMRSSDVRSKLVPLGAEPIGSTPEEFAAFRIAEVKRLTAVLAKAGIKPEF
jgi:tripartite-type tricarboxylate transporter receptor subunit TctC